MSLADESYGKVWIGYEEPIESYLIYAEFAKTGKTQLILEAPDGTREVYDLTIERNSYTVEKRP